MPFLILDKDGQGHRLINFADQISIGRDKGNDIVLNDRDDSAISRKHAVVKINKNGSYTLHDTSINGILVDGELVNKKVLSDGNKFKIIHYNFTFLSNDSPVSNWNVATIGIGNNSLPAQGNETVFLKSTDEMLDKKIALKQRLRNMGIIAENDTVLSLYMDLQEILKVNVPVLILGEPGTGKEKLAQTIHSFSKATGAFVPLNCSSIPEGIFESELFGCVRGAFNNAVDKPGKLELAQNGTIFLDEIGDMTSPLQPKLLRFLEDKKVTRLGDTRTNTINVRVVSATNQDLKKMRINGLFRDDLFQRLACITLKIPPLRKRKEDILPLADFLLEKLAKEHSLPKLTLSKQVKKMLFNYSWPGNVRELNNILLGCYIRCRQGEITASSIIKVSEELKKNNDESLGFPALTDIEKKHIQKALQHAGGNKLMAAKLLGVARETLYKKIRKYHL